MKRASPFKDLLKELGRDPRLKGIIHRGRRRARHQSRKKDSARVENASGLLLLGLALVSRFVSRKKARTIDEVMDALYLLVQISVLLKENVFDRPEVKEFLGKTSKRIASAARKEVDLILSKTGRIKSQVSKWSHAVPMPQGR